MIVSYPEWLFGRVDNPMTITNMCCEKIHKRETKDLLVRGILRKSKK